MKINGTYVPTSWDEKTCNEISGGAQKLTKTSAVFAFSGPLEGNAAVEYLMFYDHVDPKDAHRSKAQYLGLIRFVGTLNGKAGSFVMEDHGSFEGGAAHSDLKILPQSGTGELKGIHGKGKYAAGQKGCLWEMECEL